MISVIIPTSGRAERLKKCLLSLKNEVSNSDEIIVVSADRIDNTAEIFRYEGIRWFKFDGCLSEARDFGFRKARGEIIAYIDDDVTVEKGWLKAVLNTFRDKKIGGVSGPTGVSKNERKNRDVFGMNKGVVGWFYKKILLEGREKEVGRICKSGMWTPGSNFERAKKLKRLIEVDYLEACNMAVRADLLKRIGGFDKGFRGTSEWCEVDVAFRIRRLGYKLVFNPKAVVYHHVSREGIFEARVNTKERMENFLRYWFKHHKEFGKQIPMCQGVSPSASLRAGTSDVGIIARFLMVVIFWNGYWIYKAFKSRNLRWLGGVAGTFTGLWKNI